MRELDEISAVAIYPAIGIARIGNSPNEYFIGPEIPGILSHIQHDYRDPQGRILRQAARFRLFGLDADGKVIKELSADDGDITWSVHVANSKAASTRRCGAGQRAISFKTHPRRLKPGRT